MNEDVPSPIDLRSMTDAVEWERTANAKRPWRSRFFDRFAAEVAACGVTVQRILELGSGPGFLADRLLRSNATCRYVAVDFSDAMHALAIKRLGPLAPRVDFLQRDFRAPDWFEGLGQFEAIVSHQAIHELRHRQHAKSLHAQVRPLLAPGGIYLVCDHFAGAGGMQDHALYMPAEDQRQALLDAGFVRADLLLQEGGLALHRAA
jgi:SAM-dependent methyltransferase